MNVDPVNTSVNVNFSRGSRRGNVRFETTSSLGSLMAQQHKHSLTKYVTYMGKALTLLFDTDCPNEVKLMEPLEALAKMTKASQIIEDIGVGGIEWLRADSTIC